jgi:Flp pilus assembly protein TadG
MRTRARSRSKANCSFPCSRSSAVPCRQRGTQLVELAIVLPVLVLFTFLIIEGAAFVRIHQVLVNAAREAARSAVLKENQSDINSMLENIATCYVLRNGVTVNQKATCGNQTIAPPASPVCSTYSVAVSGYNGVPAVTPLRKSDGTFMNVTRVTVSCSHTLSLLPALQGLGFGAPKQVTLSSAVEFRNFF